jgi:hypothetical protein
VIAASGTVSPVGPAVLKRPERAFFAGLFPTMMFHSQTGRNVHHLSRPFGAVRVPGQRDWLVISLGAFHRMLSASANEEVKYLVERSLQIVQYVSERPALTILKKIVTSCSQFGHSVLQCGWFWRIVQRLLAFTFAPSRKTVRIAAVQPSPL